MSVAGNKRQTALKRNCCNPNIILWDRTAFPPQVVLESAVLPGHSAIDELDTSALDKLLDPGGVLSGAIGFCRAKM